MNSSKKLSYCFLTNYYHHEGRKIIIFLRAIEDPKGVVSLKKKEKKRNKPNEIILSNHQMKKTKNSLPGTS